MKYLFPLLLCCSVFLKSCKDDETNPAHIIYIGGMDLGMPVYWKNSERVALECDTFAGYISWVNALYVNGNDVFAAGTHDGKACYWKNGHLFQLPVVGNVSYATGITVLNGDIYISGSDTHASGSFTFDAVYWKNGVRIELPGSERTYATGIKAFENDIYIVGADTAVGAVYWKNEISNSISGKKSSANAISFNGSDMYIAGDSFYYAVFWKNGAQNEVPNAVQFSTVTGVIADGNELVLCGNEGNSAVIWKGALKTILPTDPDFTRGYAMGIDIINNIEYVAGYEEQSTGFLYQHAVYWKNGIRHVLPSNSNKSSANCIFIN